MKILALIPARSGSKRVPNKNKRNLEGKPLIVWSIEVALGLPFVCDVMVSTDDIEIAQISNDAGALVPWLRPDILSTDRASSIDVALHAINWYENNIGNIDGLMLLQPTSPFRTRKNLLAAIELFECERRYPVIGVSPARDHPLWTFRMEDNFCTPFFKDHGLELRSQDLDPAFVVNGSLYICTTTHIKENKSFFSNKNAPLIMNSYRESIDIDSEEDFLIASWIASQNII
jgi:CMP-N,N'-diacetyllegionaminic acid synthase